VAAILSTDLTLGFALTGIATLPASNHEEAAELLRTVSEEKRYDLVIVEEALVDSLNPNVRRDYLRRTRPLIVPIPGDLIWSDTDDTTGDDLVQRLIRQAVGYQLNIHF
jgi:vacuolar-type H+-ATPase subunit F/Vma7